MNLKPATVSTLLSAAVCGCAPAVPATVPATCPPRVATGETCKLSPAELAARREKLIPGLFKRAEKVEDIPNGLRFHFASKPGLLADLSKVMEQEQDCCSFLRFQLTMEPSGGPVTFDVTGPKGTGGMLRKL